MEYIKKKHPKIIYIGLGGTDEAGHNRNYGKYLKEANTADRIIGDLWNLVQSSPKYKNNTTFIITTDHGRGAIADTWHKHGVLVSGS
jgi:phosphopentomutase